MGCGYQTKFLAYNCGSVIERVVHSLVSRPFLPAFNVVCNVTLKAGREGLEEMRLVCVAHILA